MFVFLSMLIGAFVFAIGYIIYLDYKDQQKIRKAILKEVRKRKKTIDLKE